MHLKTSIRKAGDIFQRQRIDLPEEAGVYAFWWLGPKEKLLAGNTRILLKGPNKNKEQADNLVTVDYKDWWPDCLPYPCLYVGKSTNIKKRFGLHIKRGSARRLHEACPESHKAKPKTTSCQLRHGIEHVFPDEQNPLGLINENVGFSCSVDFPNNPVAERFFAEDLLIGQWRPWFNVDSER